MVSNRLRSQTNVGTRLTSIQDAVRELQARTRTGNDVTVEERLADIENIMEMLSSANYRLEEEYPMLDERYGGSEAFLALPDPWTYASSGNISANGAAATWTDINSNYEVVYTLTRPLWVMAYGVANIRGATSTYGMIGVDASGALTLLPEQGLDGSSGKFGYTAYGETTDYLSKTLSFSKPLLLPAGTTTLKMQHRRNVATGTPTISYPTFVVTPIMWDDITVPAPTTTTALTRRSKSTAMTLTTTDTVIDWDVQNDDSGHFTYNTSTDIWTCVIPGQYNIHPSMGLGAGTAEYGFITIEKNGTTVREILGRRDNLGGNTMEGSVVVSLVAGDTIRILARSGSSVGITASTLRSFVELYPLVTKLDGVATTATVVGRAERTSSLSVATGTSISQQTLSVTELTGDISFASNAFTVLRAGLYAVDGSIRWASNSTGNRTVYIFKNGSEYLQGTVVTTNTAGNTAVSSSSLTMRLAIGDVIDLRGWQTSGVSLNATAAFLNLTRISD